MEKLFFFLYSTLMAVAYVAALPFLLLLALKQKYHLSIPARFFFRKNGPLKSDGVWFHSCSFGEALAIKPFVVQLPQDQLRMTTTTQTGFEVVKGYTGQSRFLPFEPLLFGWLKPQKVLVVMEAEFWYLLFALAKKRGAKTLLINARMSDRSFPKYYRMRWFYAHIFRYIDEVYAQTSIDKERLELLGAGKVRVTGNIKLANLPTPTKILQKPAGFIVCGASTHEGEERLILDAYMKLKAEQEDARLILVPRHPERFEKVADLIAEVAKDHSLQWHRYSQSETLQDDIILIDRLGELVNIYAITDIVILGGAFAPIGGHNAAEAAQFGCKIISGPHYFNQKDIFGAIEGITVVEASSLSRRLLGHGVLKAAKIKGHTNLAPIIESIKAAL
ncbi:lipid IV(A) 3-deoxy-D-manno-octulosonic acid transferase [Sulfurovum sp.]|jgi:3-deoxy-D-manno-octulosonic-acid transferase|uniref:lipid IV(A) 3-deoxy-D-manno-octulosonic acid transferase n=1 Tax=Sulfurovum sp. TaxID=1969726 RepID=UPI002A35868C|nr:lipid IV(A) 3-deoxy-D-manno-octulosonic acid transferase [Sulfurovum sp.]MDD2451926.1 lipid IV(A) 3-deoxy-D-manno-octulosonic acid transferase [Sulfurovum sp.]MDY0403076.1 lipid IV(A) 3-deoxy-D-manno-octulosonic acid transferase [Sulfurovum sp.]